MVGPGCSQKVEKLCDRDEPAVLAREPLQKALESRIHNAFRAETLREMRVHDAYAPLRFQTVLAGFVDLVTEAANLCAFTTREPEVHERFCRIEVGQGRVDARNVDLVKGKVSDILDMLFADVPPKKRRTFNVPLIPAGSVVARPRAPYRAPHARRQPAGAPVQVVAIAMMICMGTRVAAETVAERLHSELNHVPRGIMVPYAV